MICKPFNNALDNLSLARQAERGQQCSQRLVNSLVCKVKGLHELAKNISVLWPTQEFPDARFAQQGVCSEKFGRLKLNVNRQPSRPTLEQPLVT
jgi:hypothetical protein